MAEPDRTDRGRQLPTGVIVAVAILVLAPVVALMWVGSYAREEPRLWGFPFFYWYQMAWVPISVLLTVIVYRATTKRGVR